MDRLAAAWDAGDVVEWVPLSLDEQIPTLVDGAVDMLAALGVTEGRAAAVDFGPALVVTGGALFAAAGTTAGDPARIATPAAGPLTDAVRAEFPAAELVLVTDYAGAFAVVLDGEVDAAALNLHVGAQMAARDHAGRIAVPDRSFRPVELAPAFRPGDDGPLRARMTARLTAGTDHRSN